MQVWKSVDEALSEKKTELWDKLCLYVFSCKTKPLWCHSAHVFEMLLSEQSHQIVFM